MASGILSPTHLAFLLVVLLMLFGAKRLPEMGRSLGTGLRGFKESLEGITDEPRPPLAAGEPGATPVSEQASRNSAGEVTGPAGHA